ncbi:OmpP1/FadL family transporter [Thermodesulfobacteriota bacterium]
MIYQENRCSFFNSSFGLSTTLNTRDTNQQKKKNSAFHCGKTFRKNVKIPPVTFCFLFILLLTASPVSAAKLEMASSWNPVGSGARALAMGGAFIGVADDATAASWNPAGLIQLERPEVSAVGAWFERTEDGTYATNPEANGSESVSEFNANYLSFAYPFFLFNRNMVVSINYQNLFDFNRQNNIFLDETVQSGMFMSERTIKEDHEGNIRALGLAWAIRLIPSITLGLTLNVWDDILGDNGWETTYDEDAQTQLLNISPVNTTTILRESEYSFSGVNANIGFLWNITPQLTLGAVLKTPFTADVERETTTTETGTGTPGTTVETEKMEMDMPMSYGLGIAYRVSDELTLSADLYRTEWDNFTQTSGTGVETSPITDLSPEASNIDPTHQIRIGAEYLMMKTDLIIPVRGGIFYDPAPAMDSPDEYYGFSIGSGLIFKRVVFDIAYQYRFGNDVGTSLHQIYDFSQDTVEHTIYTSAIVYF